MDINRARQQLLNRFPQRYRQHILDFAADLSTLDADVLIFTARKAACFFHCLEHLRLWSAGQRVITTDRLLDHDSAWLRGKRVAVVDEVIVSGTSLYRLKTALLDAGAAEVSIHALFINKDWFVAEFFADGSLANSYIELPGPDAQALGTTIVRAFQCLPRPYSIDYPMSGWVTQTEHNVDTLTALPGWTFSIVDEQWGPLEGSNDGQELEFFRFEPSRELHAELCSRIGAPASHVVLLKIRTYGRWEQSNDARTYHFRVVPYVILAEQCTADVDALFNSLLGVLSTSDQKELLGSCTTGKSRLRVVQYVLAARFARAWSEHCRGVGLRIPFVEDQRELSFVFPESVSSRLAALCELKQATHPKAILSSAASVQEDAKELEDLSDGLSASQYLELCRIFLDLYLNEEIPERTRAKAEGVQYFANLEGSGRGDRLTRGRTLPEINRVVSDVGVVVTQKQLSMFVDLAVDSGVIVPITVTRTSSEGGSTLTRAYRHGEETYIVQRDLGLFHAMLQTMAEDVFKILSENNVRAPSFGQNRLGRILTEKALVLFVRYAIDQGIFPRVYADADDRNPGSLLIGIGYDMFGARVAIGDHKPTQLIAQNTFINWLLKNGVLTPDVDGGYVVNAEWSNPFGVPDGSHMTNATRFAAVLSAAVQSRISGLQNSPGDSKEVMKAIDRTFVTITTCESEASTLMAIGAELRRFDGELLSLGVFEGATVDIRVLVTADRFVRALMSAMNSGYLKVAAFIHAEAANSAMEISKSIAAVKRDRVYAGLWDDIWRAVRREQSGQARDALVRHLSGAISVHMKGLLLVHYVREAGLAKGGAPDRKVKAASAALKAKVRQLRKLADEAIRTTTAGANNLSQTILDAIEWFEDKKKNAPQSSMRFESWAITELSKLRVHARDQFEWIDGVTSDDGRIARLKEYDSILSIKTNIPADAWQLRYAREFAELLSVTVTRFRRSAAGPRAYSQSARSPVSDQGDFHAYGAREIGGKMVLTFLGDGKRGATWLGYVQASVTKLLAKDNLLEPVFRSSVALLGLEDSRRIYRDFDNGAFVSPSTAKALMRAGHRSTKEAGSTLAILVDGAGKEEYGAAFVKEASEALRRKMTRISLQDSAIADAGGTFSIENFTDGEPIVISTESTESTESTASSEVAWILIVEDELAAVLRFLAESDIKVETNMRNDGTVVGNAVVEIDSGKISIRIFISLGQGNASIGNLLSNVCTTEGRAFKFIVVSGICCSFGAPESLTKVVMPTSALDMQIWRKTNDGRTSRAEGRPMPPGAVQLIRWYLAMRDSSLTEGVSIIDNAIMVSDNDLLRVDSPSEEHRALASQYSDKAVAYDMETAGVANWGYQNSHFPPAVVVKGLSDFGRSDKSDDNNRTVAARNAIAVSLDFIRISSRPSARACRQCSRMG